MRHWIVSTLVLMSASHASAQVSRETVTKPAFGVEQSATTGSAIFQRENYATASAVEVQGATEIVGLGSVGVKSGEILDIVEDKNQMIACRIADGVEQFCLKDRDGDGRFEKKGLDRAVLFWFGIKDPVPYTRIRRQVVTDAGNTMQKLIYLGMAGPTLRLSYREFVNDMARPAFTEELTFTLSGKSPETIAYKDLTIDVVGVDNAGLRYIIQKAGR